MSVAGLQTVPPQLGRRKNFPEFLLDSQVFDVCMYINSRRSVSSRLFSAALFYLALHFIAFVSSMA